MPPSVNSTIRSYRRTKKYRQWIIDAGKEIMVQRRGLVPVKGHFKSQIILSEKLRRSNWDLDNRIKPIFDLLESHGLIENDCLQDKFSPEWGDAPMGCKVYIWQTGNGLTKT